ncbi:hypothetical protein [Nonlabens sp. Asnod2-A12]|uniref:hypothetical protein n=1 Tax=Nonlabens sp. Asnod2-A12 TaxID=3160578 RepID=UPI00386DD1E5
MTNEIHFIDFEPQVLEKKFWTGRVYENQNQVMVRLNEWTRKNYNNEIINIETVVVPKHPHVKNDKKQNRLNMHGGHVYMIQVLRVWYK